MSVAQHNPRYADNNITAIKASSSLINNTTMTDDGDANTSSSHPAALSTQSTQDAIDQFQHICNTLKQQVTQLYQHTLSSPRSPSPSTTPSPVSLLSSSIYQLLVTLKPLNRTIQLQLEQHKSHLYYKYKQELDSLNIELASWQYEASYFQKEIAAMQQLTQEEANNTPTVDLIPIEQFRLKLSNKASTNTTAGTVSDASMDTDMLPSDPHLLHIARLQDELQERQALMSTLATLQQQRDTLLQRNQQKQQQLNALAAALHKISELLTSLQPVFYLTPEEYSYTPLPQIEQLLELPRPLYCLYAVVHSYIAMFSSETECAIKVQMKTEEATPAATHKSSTTSASASASLHQTDKHTLQLLISSAAASTLVFVFRWLPTLQVVAVSYTVEQQNQPQQDTEWTGLHKEVFAALLTNLFPYDDGSVVPSSPTAALTSTTDQTAQIAIVNTPIPAALGIPYRWCQSVCGLYYPHPSALYNVDPPLAQVLDHLIQRTKIREALVTQLYALKRTQWPPIPTPHDIIITTTAAVANGTAARVLSAFSVSKPFPLPAEIASETWVYTAALYYQAIFLHTTLHTQYSLRVQFVLTAEYPLRLPYFHLSVTSKPLQQAPRDKGETSMSIDSVAVERELQVLQSKLNGGEGVMGTELAKDPYVLTHQLRSIQREWKAE